MKVLRIKEEIDLRELEKYGFEYSETLDSWFLKRGIDNGLGLLTYSCIHIHKDYREICCGMYINCNEYHDTVRDFELDKVIYRLTVAGMVEEVEV